MQCQAVSDLLKGISNVSPSDIFVSEKFFVAGINLTENLRYILQHPFGSLKKMTLQSLPCLKIWIKQQYPGPQKECVNIIAGDFIGNNDFVKDVIELNTKINPSLPCQRKGAGTSSI